MWGGGRRAEAGGEKGSSRARGRASSKPSASVGLVAFYPTDSPCAPVSPDIEDGLFESAVAEPGAGILLGESRMGEHPAADEGSVEKAVIDALGFGGGLFFHQIVDAVRRKLVSESVSYTHLDFFSNRFHDKKTILMTIAAIIILLFF